MCHKSKQIKYCPDASEISSPSKLYFLFQLEEVDDDGVSGFSNPLAVTDGDKDNDNTVTTSHDNHNTDA